MEQRNEFSRPITSDPLYQAFEFLDEAQKKWGRKTKQGRLEIDKGPTCTY
jgi:hypothetical protein